jgi:hypothetical protein
MEAPARSCRARILAARGDASAAWADIEHALEFARRSEEPQMVYPTLADAALVAATNGGGEAAQQVAALTDELTATTLEGTRAGEWAVVAVTALALTGQVERFAQPVKDDASPWGRTARAISERRFTEAADMLADLGARSDEAPVRLLAAQAALRAGHPAAVEAELARATGFWQEVGARVYLDAAEALRAMTA